MPPRGQHSRGLGVQEAGQLLTVPSLVMEGSDSGVMGVLNFCEGFLLSQGQLVGPQDIFSLKLMEDQASESKTCLHLVSEEMSK